jgi:hypothetical protein
MVVRSSVGLGCEGKAAACAMLLSSNPQIHGRVVITSWTFLPATPHLGAFFTDVGRKLRQERFASALLVL